MSKHLMKTCALAACLAACCATAFAAPAANSAAPTATIAHHEGYGHCRYPREDGHCYGQEHGAYCDDARHDAGRGQHHC